MFNDAACNLKPIRFTICVIMRMAFFDIMTGFTDEKLSQMAQMIMITRDKSV
jgi:hypothetical protein